MRSTNRKSVSYPVAARRLTLTVLAPAALVLGFWGVGAQTSQEPPLIAKRQSHRPYDGAPPVIPHEVEDQGSEQCLACHEEGLDLGEDGVAPVTPHPQFKNCLQCHVPQSPMEPKVGNDFEGLRNPARGHRALPTAPPLIPHWLQMREKCAACHGPLGGAPIRTSHVERTNCLQCHIPGGGYPEGARDVNDENYQD